MVKVLIGFACFLPMLLQAQGFGSYTFDQPFLAKDTANPYGSLKSQLFAYYLMGNAGNQADSVDSLTFILTGVEGWTTNGIIGNAQYFNGTSFIFENSSQAYNFSNNTWSASMWFKIETFEHSKYLLDDGQKCFIVLGDATDKLYIGFVDSTSTTTWQELANWSDITNKWFHVCMGYDAGTGEVWSQVNGQTRQEAAITGGIKYKTENVIFRWNGYVTGGGQLSHWSMDEVGFWFKALTSAEVIQLCNGTNGLPLSSFYP